MDRKVILTEREAAYIYTLLGNNRYLIEDFIEHTVGKAEAKEIEQSIKDKMLLNLKP